MALIRPRFLARVLAAVLVVPIPAAAFETPLSDTAVREAYFMGQRGDESMAHFFDKYVKNLPQPKIGPYISAVSFFTPYALIAQFSNQHQFGYSAQQAELGHRKMTETVQITIQIDLTDTYPAVMPNPTGQTTGTPYDYVYRPSGFWKDFQVQVISDKKVLEPLVYSGEPNFICSDSGCSLVGATIQMEFLAEDFAPDSATVQIDPPEGEPLAVEFDLSAIR